MLPYCTESDLQKNILFPLLAQNDLKIIHVITTQLNVKLRQARDSCLECGFDSESFLAQTEGWGGGGARVGRWG